MSSEEEFYESELALKNAIDRYYKACQTQDIEDEKFCDYLAEAVEEVTGVTLSDFIM